MDPLTHTLVGAGLSRTRLGTGTRFATAALVVGANLPDVDGITYMMDSDLALHVRRGWTHGVLALVVLPFVLTAILTATDRARPSREHSVSPGRLLLISALAILTHPFLDWLNTYGMRWLMPFDDRWFYGDSVYIMDPWLWLLLGGGFLAGVRPGRWALLAWAFFALAITRTVWQRSPEYLPVVAAAAGLLLVVLLWKWPAADVRRRMAFASAGLVLAGAYIAARLVVHGIAVSQIRDGFGERGVSPVERVLASPDPLDPRKWTVVAEAGDVYRYGSFELGGRGLTVRPEAVTVPQDSRECRAARLDPSVRGFVTWARFPACAVESEGGETRVILYDARRGPEARSRGRVVVVR